MLKPRFLAFRVMRLSRSSAGVAVAPAAIGGIGVAVGGATGAAGVVAAGGVAGVSGVASGVWPHAWKASAAEAKQVRTVIFMFVLFSEMRGRAVLDSENYGVCRAVVAGDSSLRRAAWWTLLLPAPDYAHSSCGWTR
jgi:hypothetical protein